ncbi:MAG TPA: AAA family ATPase [Gaiellaceae bacterium]|jgi:DNA-binding CsgD family transcriptional regulator
MAGLTHDVPQALASARREPLRPLLERSEELGRIDVALADARAGRGRLVVIEGDPGMGKTALLAAARANAAASGMRILRARGTELEHDFAFGIVRQLFERPLAEATERERTDLLAGAAGTAAGVLGLGGTRKAGSPLDASFAIQHGLFWLSANLAAGDPLCIVVDDAQWVDRPSFRFFAFLLTRIEEIGVAILIAARPGDADNCTLLATVTRDPAGELLPLTSLSATAVAELVRSSFGRDPHPAFVAACMHATRGSPFLVVELVEALRDEGLEPSGSAVGRVATVGARTLARSIELRLSRLPESATTLARAVAILEQGDLVTAGRLAGLAPSESADAADQLVTAGILEPGRPLRLAHPMIRSAVYLDQPVWERAAGHRRAALALAERPRTTESVAQHLLLSDPAGEPWVVEQLAAAATLAMRNAGPESAAVFLRRALEEPPDPSEQSALLLQLGLAEASAGLDGWCEHLQDAVDTAPSATESARAARELARAFNRRQRFAEAVDVLDRAATALGPDDGELALQLEAAALIAAMNDPKTAARTIERRAALRLRTDRDSRDSAELLSVAAFIAALGNEPAADVAELALRSLAIDGAYASGTFARSILALVWAERFGEVRPLLDAAIEQARTAGDGGRLAVMLATRAWLELRLGELGAAELDTRAALSTAGLPAPPMYRVLNTGLLVKALVDQGRLDEADAALELVDGDANGGSTTQAVLRLARGRLRLEQGRVADGLDDFLAVGRDLTAASVVTPAFLPWRSEAALAQLALGDRAAARRLANEEVALARSFGAPRALGVALRAGGLAAGGQRGSALLRDAVAAFERAGATLERARALTDLGAMLRRGNRRVEARPYLREALDAADRLGAAAVRDTAETELRASGAKPRRRSLSGAGSLTASERRIAELASQGLTNREIAQTLFVTARTVEGHLTNVFRKLHLQSRTALAAALTADSAA